MSIWPQVVTGACTVAGALVGGGMVTRVSWKLAEATRVSEHKRELRSMLAALSMAMGTYLDTVEIASLMMAKMTQDQVLDWGTSEDAERMREQRTAVIKPLTQLKVEAGVYGFYRELDRLAGLWDQITAEVFTPVRATSPDNPVPAVNRAHHHLEAIREAMRELEGSATLELSVNAPTHIRRSPIDWLRSRAWKFWA